MQTFRNITLVTGKKRQPRTILKVPWNLVPNCGHPSDSVTHPSYAPPSAASHWQGSPHASFSLHSWASSCGEYCGEDSIPGSHVFSHSHRPSWVETKQWTREPRNWVWGPQRPSKTPVGEPLAGGVLWPESLGPQMEVFPAAMNLCNSSCSKGIFQYSGDSSKGFINKYWRILLKHWGILLQLRSWVCGPLPRVTGRVIKVSGAVFTPSYFPAIQNTEPEKPSRLRT